MTYTSLADSQEEISLNYVTSIVAKITLSALKLLLARRSFSVVHLSSSFNVTAFVLSFVIDSGDHPVKIVRHAPSSIDLMNAFTLTF